jgi:hydrogenase maturation factor
MHDPTEGGLAAALWELAAACGHKLVIDPQLVLITPLAEHVCAAFDLNPMAAIASGALLLTTPPNHASRICRALEMEGIHCREIGEVEQGKAQVWIETNGMRELLPYPERDEIARLFDSK